MPELSDLTTSYKSLEARRLLTLRGIVGAIAPPGEAREMLAKLAKNNSYLPLIQKADTSALLTTDQGLDALQPLRNGYVSMIERETLLGKTAGAWRSVPPNVPITTVATGTTASFVTEDEPIPVARPTLSDAELAPGRIALIVPFSLEAMKRSANQIAVLIERDVSRAAALGEDAALLDGAAAVAGGRPASILAGLSAVGGGSPAPLEDDVIELVANVRGGDPVAPYFITSPAGARYLATVRESGVRVFPNVTAIGGDILGIPLLVSAGSPDRLTLLDCDGLHVTGGDVEIDMATHAALQFSTTPSGGGSPVVPLFSTNSLAVRYVRRIGWRLSHADACAYIDLPVAG